MNQVIKNLKAFYSNYAYSDLGELGDLYHENVTFSDPLHTITGLDALKAYFEAGRAGLLHCDFKFIHSLSDSHTASLEWQMLFAHRRLGKREVVVNGCSMIHFCTESELVVKHTDYFDLGVMVYENVPILGSLVRSVKRVASGGKKV